MKKFLVLVCMLISACSPPPTATIPPSPQPVIVTYSPNLEKIEEALNECAENHSEFALIIEKRPANSIQFGDSDLTVWWGDKPGSVTYAYPLAQDELVIVLNQANPNYSLATNELLALFGGKVLNWNEISTFQHEVSSWIYPPENELRETFQENIMREVKLTPLSYLAPNPQAMLEAIARDPGAIGFLPRSWLSQDVLQSRIDSDLQSALDKPLLALTKTQPQGGILILLDCLQNKAGQEKLRENFSPPD